MAGDGIGACRDVLLRGGPPWGFRMQGGMETGLPLRIVRVNPGSKAEMEAVREGDIIQTINGKKVDDVTNTKAHSLLRESGNTLKLGLITGASLSRKSQRQTGEMRTSAGSVQDKGETKKVNVSDKPLSDSESNQNRLSNEGNTEEPSKFGSASESRPDRNVRTKKVTFRKSLDSVEIESCDSSSDSNVQDGIYHCVPVNISTEEIESEPTPIITKADDDKGDVKLKEVVSVKSCRRNAVQTTTEGISSILSDIESQLRGEEIAKAQSQLVANPTPPDIPFCCASHQYQYMARGFYTLPHMAPAFVPPPLPMYTPPPAYPCQQCTFPQQPFPVMFPAACQERFVSPVPATPWFAQHPSSSHVVQLKSRASPVDDVQAYGERGMADGGEVASKTAAGGLSIDELSEFLRLLEAVKQDAIEEDNDKSESIYNEQKEGKLELFESVETRQNAESKRLDLEEYDNVSTKDGTSGQPKRALPPMYFPKRFLDVIPEEGSDFSDFEIRSSRDLSDTLSDVLSGRGSIILESLSEEDEESREFSYSETPKPRSPNIRRSILSEGDSGEIFHEEDSIRLSQISNCDVGEGSSFDAVEDRSDDENEKTLVEEFKSTSRIEPIPRPRLSLIQKEVTITEVKANAESETDSCCAPSYNTLKEAFDICCSSRDRDYSFDKTTRSGFVRAEPIVVENSDESDAYSVTSEPVSEPRNDLTAFANSPNNLLAMTHAGEICQMDRRSLLLTEIPKPVAELSGFREQPVDIGSEAKTAVLFHRDNDDILLPLPVITLQTNDSLSYATCTQLTDKRSDELIGSAKLECSLSDNASSQLTQDSSSSTNVSERQRPSSFSKFFGFNRDKTKELKDPLSEKEKSGFLFPMFRRSSGASVIHHEDSGSKTEELVSDLDPPTLQSNFEAPEKDLVPSVSHATYEPNVIYDGKGAQFNTPTTAYRGVRDTLEAFKRNLLGKDKDDVPKRNAGAGANPCDKTDRTCSIIEPRGDTVPFSMTHLPLVSEVTGKEVVSDCQLKKLSSSRDSKESSPSSLTKVPPSPDLPRRVLDVSFDSLDSRSMTPCTVIEVPIHDENHDERILGGSGKPVSMGSMKARQNSFSLSKSKSFGSPFPVMTPQPIRKQTSFDDMTNRVVPQPEVTQEKNEQDLQIEASHTHVVSELRKFWLQQERSMLLKTPEPKPKWEDALKLPPPVPKKPKKFHHVEPLSKLASNALARTPMGSEIIKLVDSTVARYSKETAALSTFRMPDDAPYYIPNAEEPPGSGMQSSIRLEPLEIGNDNIPPTLSCRGQLPGKTRDRRDDRMPESPLVDSFSKAVTFSDSSECKAPKPPPRISSTEVIKRFRFGAFSPPAVRRRNIPLQRNASAPSVPGQSHLVEDGYLTDSDWRVRGYESDNRCFSEFEFSSGEDSPLPPVRPSPPCSDLDEKEFILRSRLCQNFPPPTKPRSSSYSYSKIVRQASQISREAINQKFQTARSYFEGDGKIYSPIPPAIPPPPVPVDTEAEPINQGTPSHSRQASISSTVTLESSFYSEEPTSPLFTRRSDLSASQSQLLKSPPPPPRRFLSQNLFFPANFPSDSSESGSMFGSLPRTPKQDKNRLKATLLSDWLETTKQEMRMSNSSDSSRSRPLSLEGEEAFRQSMLEEYRSRLADRMDRKQNKVIKITKSPNEHVPSKPNTNQLDDFFVKVKKRIDKYGTSIASEEEEKSGTYKYFEVDGGVEPPPYLLEDSEILLADDGSTLLASPMMSRRSRKGVWSPGQSQSSVSENNKSEEKSHNEKDEPIEPVWTPSRLRSPSLERKEFRPVKLDTKSLPRQKSTEGVQLPPTSQESFAWSVREDRRQSSQVCSPATPSSGSSIHSRPTAANTPSTPTSHLPRAPNPTVTLLQKAREGQLPRGAAYLETKKEDHSPGYRNPYEPLYTIKREYDSEEEGKRVVELSPKKYQGVGPVTGDGIPVALRNNVEDENKHQWYRRMYDSLHKQARPGNRYRPSGGRGAANGYVSEPELQNVDYDSDAASSRYGTLDRRRLRSASRENDALRNASPVYKNQPGRIENYVPGRSSVAEKEIEQQKRQATLASPKTGRYLPPPNSFTAFALKESGYESDSQVVFRKRQDSELQTPTDTKESRSLYKEIQKGVGNHHFEEREITLGYKTAISNLRTPTEGGPYADLPGDNADDPAVEAVLRERQAGHMKRIYEENKRLKYQKELEDIEMRRHGDNLMPYQKSPIPLNRYDNFMDDPPRGKSRDRTPEPKVVAKALYNFIPQSPRELGLQKGDIVLIRRQIDKNWYEGDHHAAIGIFPVNYVEIIPYDSIRATAHKRVTEGKARVKYNFIAQTPMELSLIKGEMILLTRRVDNNWLEGKIGHRKGIFPIAYVDVISEPDEGAPAPAQRSPLHASGNQLHINGALRGASQPPQIIRPPSQTQNYAGYGSLPRGGPSRVAAASPVPFVPQPPNVETQQDPVIYRAMYAYKPQNDDELELLEGDIVNVIEKCDDGWYVGTSQRTGHFGTFPGNYVERL